MKIFVSGSIGIKELDDNVKKRLDKLMDQNQSILVGDAQGVDQLVRDYLQSKNYDNVTVYSTGQARCNVPNNWTQKQTPPQKGVKGREHFALKDIAMTKDCDGALAIWDGKSKGTKDNISRAQEMDKMIIVYNDQQKAFSTTDRSLEISKQLKSKQQPTPENPTQTNRKTLNYISPYTHENENLNVNIRYYTPYGRGRGQAINMAIQTTTQDYEPYSTLTVNLADSPLLHSEELILPKNTAFIDTNNNPGITTFIRDAKLAKPYKMPNGIPIQMTSGFCTYPLYQFDENELKKYDPKGYAEYSSEYDKTTEKLQKKGFKTLTQFFEERESESPDLDLNPSPAD
jgi:hypothetical protein